MSTISQLNRTIIPINGDGRSGLVVRFPGSPDRDALGELSQRVGQPLPKGSVMLAEHDGRVIAAVALDGGPVIAESTPEAEAAVAVLRFRIHQLRHGRHPAWLAGHHGPLSAA
jgi:hypothetical protein